MHGALVDIRSCANQSLFAYLVCVDQLVAQGIAHDVRNPNPALKARPLIGLPIVWGLSRGGQVWEGGQSPKIRKQERLSGAQWPPFQIENYALPVAGGRFAAQKSG